MPLIHLFSGSQEKINSSSEDVFIALAAEKTSFNFYQEKKHKATEQGVIVFFLSSGLSNHRSLRAFNLQQEKGFIHLNAPSDKDPGSQLHVHV